MSVNRYDCLFTRTLYGTLATTVDLLPDLLRICASYSVEINESTVAQVLKTLTNLTQMELEWLATVEILIAIQFDTSFCVRLEVPSEWYLRKASESEYVLPRLVSQSVP